MFRPMWPLSCVTVIVVQKLLCTFGPILVRSLGHLCAAVSLGDDGPLSLCFLCVAMTVVIRQCCI
jgi:hypothetical protein